MAEGERYTLPLTFFSAFLLGRAIWAKEERVEPRIVFVPLQTVDQIAGAQPSAQGLAALQEVGRYLQELQSSPALRRYIEALKEREEAVRMLKLANKALEDGRISTPMFQNITRRYLQRLIEIEKDIDNIEKELYEIVNKINQRTS